MLSLFTLPDSTPGVILNLSIILAAGFLATRATKKIHLPNVTGYILAGVLIGPYLLDLIPSSIIEDMDFITDIALALIAFGTGKYFRFSQLRRNGKGVFVITLWESLAAAVLVTLVMSLLFRLPLSFSLLLGAISSATAPASTLMTIRQYHAEGEFIQVLLQVVALDDAVALIAFSICAAIVQAMDGDGITPSIVLLPVLLQLVSLVLGALGGYLLSRWINAGRSDEHSLVLALAVILSITGFCAFQDISPLLACMVLGAVYINCGGNERLFHLIDRFSPPILLLFFVLSGMRLDVPALKVATLNAKHNNVDYEIVQSDFLSEFLRSKKTFDLIVSNPPYIGTDDEIGEEIKYEPEMALFAPNNGMEPYYRILTNLSKVLSKDGIAFFETSALHHDEYLKFKSFFPRFNYEFLKDYSNKWRFMIVTKKNI